MSRSHDAMEELGELAAALCDGEITRSEARRLEELARGSPEALRYFLHYTQLHGELHWDTAVGAELDAQVRGKPAAARPGPPPLPARPAARQPRRRTIDRWIGIAAAAAVLIFVGAWAVSLFLGRPRMRPSPAPPQVVARLTRTVDVRWADEARMPDGSSLSANQVLNLDGGLAEVEFQSGARVILEGPAQFKVQRANQGALDRGSLIANVPAKAASFTIRTPTATVIDRGTEIGVAVERNGDSEVHVFAGRVAVQAADGPAAEASQQEVEAGQAVQVSLRAGGPPEIREIPLASHRFVRALPGRNSVAKLRQLVAGHPQLLHHYTFEGANRQDKCRDKHGRLDLVEVPMVGGDGGLDVYELAPGFDRTGGAVRAYRSDLEGDSVGKGLKSQEAFRPPENMTVELLLKLERSPDETSGTISTAVAVRLGPRGGAFLGVAADRGRLAYWVQDDAATGLGDVTLVPRDWYYVAQTLQADSGRTTVSCYVANLSRGEQELTPVVENVVVQGTPAEGSLGIGKGFNHNLDDAYPWPGVLDEIAIYAAVLENNELQQHLQVLFETQ